MTLSWEQIVAVIGAGSTIGSSIFWGALWLGRLTNRIERVERRVNDHDDEFRVLKGLTPRGVPRGD